MANEYLMKKWKLWFKCLDRKHTGQLTREDEKRDEEALVRLAHLEGQRKEEVLQTSQSLWNKFIFHGKSGPVTQEEFVQRLSDDLKNDKKKFEEDMRKACIDDTAAINQSGGDYLNEEDFTNAYKSIGFEDEAWIKKMFGAFRPVDGKARIDDMVEAWFQFLTSEDSSKKDVVLELLSNYPDL